MLYGGPDYQAKADDTVLAFGMIETREALGNLDAILSTPELDAAYIGPSDLAISLGLPPGLDRTEDAAMAAIRAVLEGCRRHRIKAAIHTGSTAYAKRMIAMGFDLVTVLSDARRSLLHAQFAFGRRLVMEPVDDDSVAARAHLVVIVGAPLDPLVRVVHLLAMPVRHGAHPVDVLQSLRAEPFRGSQVFEP